MAIYLFHGDDQHTSRQAYNAASDRLRSKGIILQHLDGSSLTGPDLELSLATANLFSDEALTIDNLFSRLKSKDQSACLTLLGNYQGAKDILMWEKKELTKTHLKNIPAAKIKLAKIPAIVFQLTDSLLPNSRTRTLELLSQTKPADEGFAFIMLARRVSELIIAKSGDASKLSPWLRSRLLSQAKPWDEAKLIELHRSLTEFDYKLKTGKTKLSYREYLDLLLAEHLG